MACLISLKYFCSDYGCWRETAGVNRRSKKENVLKKHDVWLWGENRLLPDAVVLQELPYSLPLKEERVCGRIDFVANSFGKQRFD